MDSGCQVEVKEVQLTIDIEAVEAFHPNVDVRDLRIMTLGPISRGSLVYRGTPFLWYDNPCSIAHKLHVAALLSVKRDVLHDLRDIMKDMAPRDEWDKTNVLTIEEECPQEPDLVAKRIVSAWYNQMLQNKMSDEELVEKLMVKAELNGYVHNDTKPDARQYVYKLGALFEHACYPNCSYSLVETSVGVCLEIYAVRDLAQGVACTVMFYPNLIDNPNIRKTIILKRRGATCECDSCNGRQRKGPRHFFQELDAIPNLHLYCNNCGLKRKLSACARCNEVFYCSRECQVMHWSAWHKRECRVQKT